ncbi:MAG TPA: NrsF family protein [Roseiarcus sp.]|nr:NrsF family protein [Roseiarcus sp.]
MKTSDLIAALAADPQPRGMALSRRYVLALALGLTVSACAFFVIVGPRHDIAHALGTLRFDWKFVDTIALAIPTALLARRLLRPGAGTATLAIALLVPVIALGGSVAMELMMVPSDLWMTKLVGTNAIHCLTLIPLLSIAPLAALIFVMRAGAPANPSVAGAVAGLAAAGLAATLYASNCTDDSPLFVATWYTIATAIVAGAGAIVGERLLRW